MFFDPSLEFEAEEAAAAEAAAAAPPPPPPAPAPPAPPTPPKPRKNETKAPAPAPAPAPARTKLVGVVETIRVEVADAAAGGASETLALPDGRVVAFDVPAGLGPGDAFDVEVSRVTYDAQNPAPTPKRTSNITRDDLAAFFRAGVAAMERPETRAALRDPAAEVRPGPQLVEIQQRGFDAAGIDRRAGCAAAARAQADYGDDAELKALQRQFMATAQAEYIAALEDLKPASLVSSGTLPRATVLEFFDACNTTMQLPATKKRLADAFRATKQPPNELIITIQKDMLETLGYEREWACSRLNKLGEDHPNDEQLAAAMQHWAASAQNACRIAMTEGDAALAPDSAEMQDIAALQGEARASLATMGPAARDAFLESMKSKVKIFQKLNPPDRLRYVNKLPKKEKLAFVKAQVLMMEQMQGLKV